MILHRLTKLEPTQDWFVWFAWRPVRLEDGTLRWLEMIEKRTVWISATSVWDSGYWQSEYRPSIFERH